MLKKIMLAGLMSVTALAGISPAYAQAGQDRGSRGERAARGDGNVVVSRGNRMAQPRNEEARGQRAQQRQAQRPAGQMAPPRPDSRWRGDPNLPANRAVEQGARDRRAQRQDGRNDQRADRRDDRQQGRDDRRDGRQDARNDRQDWRNDRRDDRQNDRRDWRDNRGNEQRWTGNRARSDNRRYDDRTRWSNQRRWDNGWRQDRRYDWSSYRNRYGDRYRVGRYYAPRGWAYGYRRYSVGIVLNSLFYSNSYWINDPYQYRLPPAYGTLRWVRYYDDALLVDIRDGYVVDVIHNFFW